MKTKNKMLALLEIAVVLCSVFLVALPTIAAEQNQEMQEVSANTITTASEDDFVLGIYGNANEDDTIDMRDLTYVKLIFFGKKPVTELADAKYDGKINPLDFIQIKLIIVGKEKELTIVDSADRTVTVKKPVESIVVTFPPALEMLRSVGVEENKIIGVESTVQSSEEYKIFFPEYQDKTTVGNWGPDCEVILDLHPDVTILMSEASWAPIDKATEVLEAAGLTVIRIYGCVWGKNVPEEVKKLGYLLDKQDEADAFLDFYEGWMNSIKETVETIPEADKPKVYLENIRSYSTAAGVNYPNVEAAGGKNIFFDMKGWGYGSVDPEAVIDRKPDIIVKLGGPDVSGYQQDAGDTAGLKEVRDEIMSRPELQNVKAVKGGCVYIFSGYLTNWDSQCGCRSFLHISYMAKWFHPELFEDLDPKAIHQEYLTRFCGLDIDLDKKGVFVYPPLED